MLKLDFHLPLYLMGPVHTQEISFLEADYDQDCAQLILGTGHDSAMLATYSNHLGNFKHSNIICVLS